jgi:probable phosphoglycerate mutase
MDESSFYRQQVVLVRHGDTEWAVQGRHTGRTDVPLTERGRQQAAALARLLQGRKFARVLVSPLQRALETCRLAGFGDVAEVREDLAEWDYGGYEGRTTPEILAERPGWTLWDDGVPGGETVEDVGRRADRVIAEVRATDGDVAIFAHGHILRILAARWIDLAPKGGQLFALDPAGVSVLGYEHTWAVLAHWNETPINADEEDHHDIAAAL